jgi:7-alpha-hydroxysteroid dehydrogenase
VASTLEQFTLTDKVAIITGAGQGIGAAIAVAMADAGADVVLNARTPEDLEGVAKEVRDRGRRALALPGDINDFTHLATLVEGGVGHFGRLDVVVNNAGGSSFQRFFETTVEELEGAIRFNLLAPFELVRLSVPHLLAQPGAAVLNISSMSGRTAERAAFSHSLMKSAVNQMTRLMAADLAPKVRVNAILPGAIETSALSRALVAMDPSVRAAMIANTPMRRNGLPEDIASAAVFLCSAAASWVTGKLLEVDGAAGEGLIPQDIPDL